MKYTRIAAAGAFIGALVAFTAITASAEEHRTPDGSSRPLVTDEPRYQGKTLTFWLKIIHERDDELISVAFDAIRSLGPNARAAVPELTEVVAAPFAPVDIGKDSQETIANKLYDIEVRSEAIDTLAAIGEAAAPSTAAVVQWALTLRVLPTETTTRDEDEQFIELVALDAQYRIGVIRAVTQFGSPAFPTLKRLLKSADVEKRKLAVAILGAEALHVAADLLKGYDCEEQLLALAIFRDLDPLVPAVYLDEMKRARSCSGN